MITKEQCRAARSFLGITQTHLADLAGMSKTAITHFESGLFTPRQDNMLAIKSALEGLGIQFIGLNGVQKGVTISRTLEGETMSTDLWDDIFETLKHKGGEVCIAYVNERDPAEENYDKLMAHLDRLKEHNIKERLLSCEGDTYFLADMTWYRWLPYNVYKAGSPFFVYGDKVAWRFWDSEITIIIDNPKIAEVERKRFEYLWQMSRIPDFPEK